VLGMAGPGGPSLGSHQTAFGMQVMYHKRSGALPSATTDVRMEYVGRSELFRRADFLTLHV